MLRSRMIPFVLLLVLNMLKKCLNTDSDLAILVGGINCSISGYIRSCGSSHNFAT